MTFSDASAKPALRRVPDSGASAHCGRSAAVSAAHSVQTTVRRTLPNALRRLDSGKRSPRTGHPGGPVTPRAAGTAAVRSVHVQDRKAKPARACWPGPVSHITATHRCVWPRVIKAAVQFGSSFTRMLRNETVPWSPCKKKAPGSVTFLSSSLPVALLHSTAS